MPNARLTDEDVSLIQEALEATTSQRKAQQFLSNAGYEFSVGTINNVARTGKGSAKVLSPLDPLFRSDLVRELRKGWRTVDTLAEKSHTSTDQVEETLVHLEERGYNLLRDGPRVRIAKETPETGKTDLIDQSPLVGDMHVFGALGDTQLCSKYQRLDILEAAYNYWAKLGVTHVYHTGNMVDGEFRHNRFELKAHGIADQTLYCLDHYPQRSGMTTHFIIGECHEGWWLKREGINWGTYLGYEARERGRDDMHYVGFMEADIKLLGKKGHSWLRLFHPGGGTAYAISYRIQKIIQSLQGGEKPAILLCGHFHKAEYLLVRNVHCLQTACMQDQSPFMRKQSIEAHLGFWTVWFQLDAKGAVRRFRSELTNYYDRKYHASAEWMLTG